MTNSTANPTIEKKKYSYSLLCDIRNKIPIHWLIYEKFKLETHFNRIWHFKCPICHEFNTAIKRETNLSRCFTCERNFNPIDITIFTKKREFIESVEFLLP